MGTFVGFFQFIRKNIETILVAMILLSYSILIIMSIVFVKNFV